MTHAYRASPSDPWERIDRDTAIRMRDAGFQIETWEQAAKDNAEIVADERRGITRPKLTAVMSQLIDSDTQVEIERRRERNRWRHQRRKELNRGPSTRKSA